MKRIPSTVALAAWIGFVATSLAFPSMTAAAGARAVAAEATGLAAMLGTAALVAAACLVVTMLAASLVFLHASGADRHAGERRADGETLAMLGLASLGILAALGWVSNSGPFPDEAASMPFWGLLALSCGAVLFDRAITVDEVGDDDEDFEAAIGAIAQGMARQTYLHAEPGSHRTRAIMDRTR